jgi:hypothetical protein
MKTRNKTRIIKPKFLRSMETKRKRERKEKQGKKSRKNPRIFLKKIQKTN